MAYKENRKLDYSLRLTVILFDVAVASLSFIVPGLLFPPLAILNHYVPVLILIYYTWFDFRGTRSLGKRLLGVHSVLKDGEPVPFGRRLVRAALRWLMPAFAIVSWHRVSALDWLSGIRLVKSAISPRKISGKKKKREFLTRKVPTPSRRAFR